MPDSGANAAQSPFYLAYQLGRARHHLAVCMRGRDVPEAHSLQSALDHLQARLGHAAPLSALVCAHADYPLIARKVHGLARRVLDWLSDADEASRYAEEADAIAQHVHAVLLESSDECALRAAVRLIGSSSAPRRPDT